MRLIALCFSLVLSLAASPADAQRAQPRIQGEPSGLEMSLEGAVRAPRGGTLRWSVTGYEVLGLSELRPAGGVTVHVATSLAHTEERVFTADAGGRALIELPIPEDAPDSFRVVLRLVAGDVQRRFELSVQVDASEAVEVHVARRAVLPGGPLRVFGRRSDRVSGAPRADAPVRLTLRDAAGRPLGAPVERRTDAAGLFAHVFRIPADVRGSVQVEARVGPDEHPVVARAGADVAEPTGAPILVAVAPERALVRPGERVALEVAVRTSNGRPIEGAVVTLRGAAREDAERRAQTDARGRARLGWTAPQLGRGQRDVAVEVTANREGLGSAVGAATIRVAADEHAAALAVEGGALSPELGGKVWIRVVGADGRPAAAGVPVRIEGPRITARTAATDDDGIATFELALRPSVGAMEDRCGGESATALEVRAGEATLAPCVPLDPDAAARVRLARPWVEAGSSLELTVERVRAAARAPVAVTVSTEDAVAVAAATLDPGERRIRVPIGADVRGLLFVRARPLIENVPVRGGSAAVFVHPGAPFRAEATLGSDGTVQARFDGSADAPAIHTYVVAAPVDLARALATSLRQRTLFGALRRDPAEARDELLFAALAARTTADAVAPAVLRGGDLAPMPAPADPTSAGLLRDPWRSRARFVTGRLALIFHALERYVAEALPDRIDDVAVRSPRGYELNGQLLESVAASGALGPAGATGLGGEPLTIEALRGFDPALTYDNVARRITRERLFRLLVALRAFVQAQGFDLPWSRLGDPSTWLRQLEGRHVVGVGMVQRQHLVDGWGRPFRLVPARGGRSRFTFVDPLGAWELVSSGPDGRVGSGDDVWDPTARVLRSGTPYAEAVGEDVLVARLEGVELGRASVALLAGADPRVAEAGRVPASDAPARARAEALWNALPAVFEPDPEPLALRRPAHPGHGAGGRIEVLAGSGGTIALTLDEEPRTWGAVVYAWTPAGFGSVGFASALSGAPLIVEGAAPARLRTGEPVTMDLIVTNIADATTLHVEAAGEGVAVEAPEVLAIGGGEAAPLSLRLVPDARPGEGSVTLTLREGGERVRTLRWRTSRESGLHPLRLRAAGLARGRDWVASLPVPSDAERIAGRVIVLAPSALAADPDLADLRRRDPALVAWSHAMAGRRPDPTTWSQLLRAQQPDGTFAGDEPWISSSAAVVALASAGEHDAEARAALGRGRAVFRAMDATRTDPDALRVQAAVLAALAAGGVPTLDAARGAVDPVSRAAGAVRDTLRRALREHPDEPSLLARASAALLLAEPADGYGLAMLERAAAHLVEAPDEGAMVRPSERLDAPLEALSATLALAVAAHQAGHSELAERLVRGGLGREHVALRRGGEAALWLLAGGAYGVLGVDPEEVTVLVDGERHAVALERGRGVVPIAGRRGEHEVRVVAPEGTGLFVRAELAMERPYVARTDGPLRLALRGDVGGVDEVAALELSVRAERPVSAPVVDLALPAGVEADDALRAALERAGGVVRAEARNPGMVRITLGPMAAGVETIVPLPLRWSVRGRLTGLAAIGYPEGDPGAMTVLAPRELRVAR